MAEAVRVRLLGAGVADTAPTPAELSQAGLMMRAAQVGCGLPGSGVQAQMAQQAQTLAQMQGQQQTHIIPVASPPPTFGSVT